MSELIAEEEVYIPLKNWIETEFSSQVKSANKITFAEITKDKRNFKSENKKGLGPDVAAVDSQRKLIIFECKSSDQAPDLQQLFEYASGANYVYAVVDKCLPNLNQFREVFRCCQIGLITYAYESRRWIFETDCVSKDFQGKYAKTNVKLITEDYEKKPKIIIFPHDKKNFPVKEILLNRIKKLQEGDIYGYKVPRPLQPGSIVLFAYEKEIVGQAVVKVWRKPTAEEKAKIRNRSLGYEPKYVFEAVKELVSIFPQPVKITELKRFQGMDKKKIHSTVRNYPYLSTEEYLEILSKTASLNK